MRPLLDTLLLELRLKVGMWEHLSGRVTATLTSAEREQEGWNTSVTLLMFGNKTILVMNNAYCTTERNCVYFIGLKVILSTWHETPQIPSNFFLSSFALTLKF